MDPWEKAVSPPPPSTRGWSIALRTRREDVNVLEAVHRVVPSACEELLAAFGGRPKKQASADLAPLRANPQNYAAGIVDFAGETMNGSLTFLAAFDFVAAFGPSGARTTGLRPKSAADWVRVRDCAMEMSNQLLGRIKNQLRKLGVKAEPKLPRAVSGYALLVTLRERTERPLVYVGTTFEVYIWFEALVQETAAAAVGGTRVEVVAEGDFVEF